MSSSGIEARHSGCYCCLGCRWGKVRQCMYVQVLTRRTMDLFLRWQKRLAVLNLALKSKGASKRDDWVWLRQVVVQYILCSVALRTLSRSVFCSLSVSSDSKWERQTDKLLSLVLPFIAVQIQRLKFLQGIWLLYKHFYNISAFLLGSLLNILLKGMWSTSQWLKF